MLLARLSRTIQIENNETNDCETLFPCALLEKDGEIERSRSKLSFASCYPLFHQHLSARSQRMRLGRGEGEQEFFAACLLPISCTSPDTSSLLTSRPSSLVSFLRFTLQSPILLRLLFFHPTHPLRPTSDPSIKGTISLSFLLYSIPSTFSSLSSSYSFLYYIDFSAPPREKGESLSLSWLDQTVYSLRGNNHNGQFQPAISIVHALRSAKISSPRQGGSKRRSNREEEQGDERLDPGGKEELREREVESIFHEKFLSTFEKGEPGFEVSSPCKPRGTRIQAEFSSTLARFHRFFRKLNFPSGTPCTPTGVIHPSSSPSSPSFPLPHRFN